MNKKTTRPIRRPEYWMVIGSLCIVSICYFGIRSAAVLGLAAVTALVTDFVCLFLRGRSYRIVDLANIGNALLLALMFPATVPYSILLLSTVFAVAVGTHVFGDRKDYVFPPCAVGYLFAVISWPKSVLQFPKVGERLELFHNDVALYPSISASAAQEGLGRMHFSDLLVGNVTGAVGTSCLLLLLVGGMVLFFRNRLNTLAAAGYAISVFLFNSPTELNRVELLCTNMLLFTMIFLVGDPAAMPCRSFAGLFGGMFTGCLTVFLLAIAEVEYAPIIAVILSVPVWRGLRAAEDKIDDFFFVTEKEEEHEQA